TVSPGVAASMPAWTVGASCGTRTTRPSERAEAEATSRRIVSADDSPAAVTLRCAAGARVPVRRVRRQTCRLQMPAAGVAVARAVRPVGTGRLHPGDAREVRARGGRARQVGE